MKIAPLTFTVLATLSLAACETGDANDSVTTEFHNASAVTMIRADSVVTELRDVEGILVASESVENRVSADILPVTSHEHRNYHIYVHSKLATVVALGDICAGETYAVDVAWAGISRDCAGQGGTHAVTAQCWRAVDRYEYAIDDQHACFTSWTGISY